MSQKNSFNQKGFTVKYKALGKIMHSNGIAQAGDIVEFSSVDAAPLLEVKAIEPYHKPFSAALKTLPGETPSEGREA